MTATERTGNGLAHLVDDGGRQLPQRSNAVGMGQLRLHLTQGLGGALTIGDILGHDNDDGPILDQHSPCRLANPERLPILAQLAQLPTPGLPEMFEAKEFIPRGVLSVSLRETESARDGRPVRQSPSLRPRVWHNLLNFVTLHSAPRSNAVT
jgi:hypothetical protein